MDTDKSASSILTVAFTKKIIVRSLGAEGLFGFNEPAKQLVHLCFIVPFYRPSYPSELPNGIAEPRKGKNARWQMQDEGLREDNRLLDIRQQTSVCLARVCGVRSVVYESVVYESVV